MSAHSANPGNFANRPTEEVKAIASMGGKASHGPHKDSEDEQPQEASHAPGRNADGTFTKGSEAAAQAGHLGGLHAHQKIDEKIEGHATTAEDEDRSKIHNANRNADGTFAKKDEQPAAELPAGRNADGTFTKGSEAAAQAGHLGGLHAAGRKDVNELEVQPEKGK